MEIYVHIIYSVRMSLQYVDVNLTGSKVVGIVNSSTLQPMSLAHNTVSLTSHLFLSLSLSLSLISYLFINCLSGCLAGEIIHF